MPVPVGPTPSCSTLKRTRHAFQKTRKPQTTGKRTRKLTHNAPHSCLPSLSHCRPIRITITRTHAPRRDCTTRSIYSTERTQTILQPYTKRNRTRAHVCSRSPVSRHRREHVAQAKNFCVIRRCKKGTSRVQRLLGACPRIVHAALLCARADATDDPAAIAYWHGGHSAARGIPIRFCYIAHGTYKARWLRSVESCFLWVRRVVLLLFSTPSSAHTHQPCFPFHNFSAWLLPWQPA